MGRPSVEDNPTLFHYGKGRNSRQRSTLRTCVRASSCSGGFVYHEIFRQHDLSLTISDLTITTNHLRERVRHRFAQRYVTALRSWKGG